jgi:hypothetical protein
MFQFRVEAVHASSEAETNARYRLAIVVAAHCIELPASGVLAILCQASFSGCFPVIRTVKLSHVLFSSNRNAACFSSAETRRKCVGDLRKP